MSNYVGSIHTQHKTTCEALYIASEKLWVRADENILSTGSDSKLLESRISTFNSYVRGAYGVSASGERHTTASMSGFSLRTLRKPIDGGRLWSSSSQIAAAADRILLPVSEAMRSLKYLAEVMRSCCARHPGYVGNPSSLALPWEEPVASINASAGCTSLCVRRVRAVAIATSPKV
eukprot:scaffold2773_cov410-Prasinococcus_capsulatus_cf.AAC.7